MEPSLIGWEWHPTMVSTNFLSRAAMEPSLIGWEWVHMHLARGSQYVRRNGAQPYRLGMGVEFIKAGRNTLAAMEPSLIGWEWSAIGANSSQSSRAAMEPSLIGWEWISSSRFRVYLNYGRNGAQPYRLGMVRHPGLAGQICRRRNGAQPYRLGMDPQCVRYSGSAEAAAMEPSLIGWEWGSPLTLPLATSLAHVFEHCDPDAETDSLITLALG